MSFTHTFHNISEVRNDKKVCEWCRCVIVTQMKPLLYSSFLWVWISALDVHQVHHGMFLSTSAGGAWDEVSLHCVPLMNLNRLPVNYTRVWFVFVWNLILSRKLTSVVCVQALVCITHTCARVCLSRQQSCTGLWVALRLSSCVMRSCISGPSDLFFFRWKKWVNE